MKKLELTKIILISLIAASVLVLTPVSANAAWKHDSKGWWNKEGNSWSIGWKEIDGKWYYFGEDGYMVHDSTIDGCKLGSDGACIKSIENTISNPEESEKDEKIAENYFKSQGYEIIKLQGKVSDSILEKNMLWGANGSYAEVWAVQKEEPDKYFGKRITAYRFIVKNHPLEKVYKVNTIVYIMISEGKIIGGTSFPYTDIDGNCFSLDGKTLEDIKGISYQQWFDNLERKYSK